MKTRVLYVYADVWKESCTVIVSPTINAGLSELDELLEVEPRKSKYWEDHGDDNFPTALSIIVTQDDEPKRVMILTAEWDEKLKSRCVNIGSISHECTHIAMWMLDSRGEDVSGEDHESLAYLQEYLISTIIKKIEKERGMCVSF